MARVGPVILEVAGDQYISATRVLTIIWNGSTSSGDTAVLNDRDSGDVFWKGITDSEQTYLGANFGPEGIHLPTGFRLSQISGGAVYVYLREG